MLEIDSSIRLFISSKLSSSEAKGGASLPSSANALPGTVQNKINKVEIREIIFITEIFIQSSRFLCFHPYVFSRPDISAWSYRWSVSDISDAVSPVYNSLPVDIPQIDRLKYKVTYRDKTR
ncbi:MAG: hypothetical protein AB3K77_06995 [Methanosarcinaceae archaeon]